MDDIRVKALHAEILAAKQTIARCGKELLVALEATPAEIQNAAEIMANDDEFDVFQTYLDEERFDYHDDLAAAVILEREGAKEENNGK